MVILLEKSHCQRTRGKGSTQIEELPLDESSIEQWRDFLHPLMHRCDCDTGTPYALRRCERTLERIFDGPQRYTGRLLKAGAESKSLNGFDTSTSATLPSGDLDDFAH